MKKLKIMLLSFAVLAVVGGALAFKARTGVLSFCTALTNGAASGDVCTVQAGVKKYCPINVGVTTQSPTIRVCTTDKQDLDGNGSVECEIPGFNTVQCATTLSIKVD